MTNGRAGRITASCVLNPLPAEALRSSCRSCWARTRRSDELKSFLLERAGRKSVLHRRGRANAGRTASPGGRAQQLPPGEAALEDRSSAHRAGRARRAYRRAAGGREEVCCRRRRSSDMTPRFIAAARNLRAGRGRASRLARSLQTAEFPFATQLFPIFNTPSSTRSLTTLPTRAAPRAPPRYPCAHRSCHREALRRPLGEQVERLARSCARGELPEKAVTYLRQAGTKAADRQAYPEAVVLFEQALQALAGLPQISGDTEGNRHPLRYPECAPTARRP